MRGEYPRPPRTPYFAKSRISEEKNTPIFGKRNPRGGAEITPIFANSGPVMRTPCLEELHHRAVATQPEPGFEPATSRSLQHVD